MSCQADECMDVIVCGDDSHATGREDAVEDKKESTPRRSPRLKAIYKSEQEPVTVDGPPPPLTDSELRSMERMFRSMVLKVYRKAGKRWLKWLLREVDRRWLKAKLKPFERDIPEGAFLDFCRRQNTTVTKALKNGYLVKEKKRSGSGTLIGTPDTKIQAGDSRFEGIFLDPAKTYERTFESVLYHLSANQSSALRLRQRPMSFVEFEALRHTQPAKSRAKAKQGPLPLAAKNAELQKAAKDYRERLF